MAKAQHWIKANIGIQKGWTAGIVSAKTGDQDDRASNKAVAHICEMLITSRELVEFNTQTYRFERGGVYMSEKDMREFTELVWKR